MKRAYFLIDASTCSGVIPLASCNARFVRQRKFGSSRASKILTSRGSLTVFLQSTWLSSKAISLENSRKMKEKSHRASQRCYRCGVETRLHAHARRLDGYRLYSASHVRIRAKSEAGGHGLRHG